MVARRRANMNKLRKTLLIVAASMLAVLFLLPLIWMVSTSLKNDFEALAGQMNFIPKKPTLENYVKGLSGELMNVPIMRWIVNSLSVGVIGTAIVLFIDSMAAYALA